MKKGLYSIGGIVILLIAAFIFVLVPALAGQSESRLLPEYGRVYGEPVKFEEGSEFYQVANQIVQQMQQQGSDFNADYASFYYTMAFSQAFNQVAGPMALRAMAAKSGFVPPDTAVERTLIERYYSEAGAYSQAAYNATSDDAKLSYQEQTQKELFARRTYEDFFGSFEPFGKEKIYGLKSSSSEIEFIRKMGETLFGFEYASFNMQDFPKEKVEEYAKSNKEKFAKYDFTAITFEDEAKANDVLKRLSNEEITFEDAVTTYSTKTIGNAETGKISQNRRYQIAEQIKSEETLEKILSLQKGKISEPAELNSGWAVFRCDGEKIEADALEEEDEREIRSYIFSREKGIVEDYFTAIANDFIAAAATSSFDEACKKFEKEKGEIAPFALNYNDTTLLGKSALSEKNEFTAASSNEAFLQKAFSLKEGEVSSPIVLSATNYIVVLRCSKIEEGGTSKEDAPKLIGEEIVQADSVAVNSAILKSDEIVSNSQNFMAAFTGER